MDYDVRVVDAAARPTAVVPARTTWPELPSVWGDLLGQVWACLRASGITRGCPNVMLYLDDAPTIEIGVLLDRPCELSGAVVRSSLPQGRAAMTVHRGSYAGLGDAHDAVLRWCAENGLRTTRTRWEVYGPHDDDPNAVLTQVYWLLE
jgi:effector-binding domain-containing protein